jgi:hypothetical protein
LGDIRAWLKAQGDPAELLAEIDPRNIRETMNRMDTLRALLATPNVEFVRFEKSGQRGALTMVIGHQVGEVVKEKVIWLPAPAG